MDFRRMRFLINRLPMAQFRLMKAMSKATRITPVLSDMPRGGGGQSSQVESGFLIIEAAQGALDNIMRELSELRRELEPHIKRLEDPLEKQTMQMRYMEGHSVREIAYGLNYSERRIFQVLSKAEHRVNNGFH